MTEKKVGAGVGIMILKDEKILLAQRTNSLEGGSNKFKLGGTWTMPGGKLEFGESFEECAIRETLEETNLKIKNPKVICVNNDKNENAHFITIGLLCEEFEGELKEMEPEKLVNWTWFGLNELPENIYFPSAKIIENYKKGEFYIK